MVYICELIGRGSSSLSDNSLGCSIRGVLVGDRVEDCVYLSKIDKNFKCIYINISYMRQKDVRK